MQSHESERLINFKTVLNSFITSLQARWSHHYLRLRASRSHSRLLHSLELCALRLIFSRFVSSGFVFRASVALASSSLCSLCAHKNFRKKKGVSQSTQNDPKRIQMHKNIFLTHLTHYALRAQCKAQAEKRKLTFPISLLGSKGVAMPSFMPIGPKLLALQSLLPITRFARSAKPERRSATLLTPCHSQGHDWIKTVGARGIQTDKQTNKQTNQPSYFNSIDLYRFHQIQFKRRVMHEVYTLQPSYTCKWHAFQIQLLKTLISNGETRN